MSRALVLNASYEPLCVVPSRRAVVLVLGHKADVLHDTGEAVHSEHLTVAVPSVIRLRHYVKVPYRRRAPLNRRGVFARDSHRCQYCSAAAESIDHVIPRSKGGEHTWENVVAACRPCNVRKRDRLLHETTMVLRSRPSAPASSPGSWWRSAPCRSTGSPTSTPPRCPRERARERTSGRAGCPRPSRRTAMSWRVDRWWEAPSASHARALPEPAERGVWVFAPTVPALVLGSAQSLDVVDEVACAAAGVEVVRRRSGGGAVLVAPGDVLWVDVLLPAGDPLWDHDVGRAFGWLGSVWAAALEDLGVATSVHRGALQRARWSHLVCFAGLGPGELLASSGAKVVGMAQRRTRDAARFQCAVLGRWDPHGLVRLLALTDDERAVAAADLRAAAAGVGVGLDALLAAFLHRLP